MTTRGDAFAATVDSGANKTVTDDLLGATMAAGGQTPLTATMPLTSTTRPAVLPRAGESGLVAQGAERYAKKKVLGAGGMGEVVLAEDRDIGRNVALKYLHSGGDASALARFVDEIRIVGSLEHPNIVPIHDVGVDENSRYYFVMKHVEGETLEEIIAKLAAGDPTYLAKYTFTARAEIFIALLRALQFAHANGYVHRDIKPANVMVGAFGEVMLMDWGVAKRCKAPEEVGGPIKAEEDVTKSVRERLFTTRRGAIIGTPAYMSPEQARGEVEKIDERSDIYCATVLFHELMTLRHYLGEPSNLAELLKAIQEVPPTSPHNYAPHPIQGNTPAEYCHFLFHGLQKDPAARFQNVTEMIQLLQETLDGKVKVQCPVTLTKRFTRELGRFTDRNPRIAMSAFFGGSIGFVALLAWSIFAAIRLHG
ncbi:MAG TPA: serine/threonine-protein kinase [Polyangiaceae bacterium]|jgi:serine/threonine-protein kinase|nr:serine/threonine-protein kinase [Polyangiaceae bacterium]